MVTNIFPLDSTKQRILMNSYKEILSFIADTSKLNLISNVDVDNYHHP